MTCQHCQTWVLDGDDRCSRCGRRVKSTSARISPQTYPIAATATAAAYEYEAEPIETVPEMATVDSSPSNVQQALFSVPSNDPRIIPFDSLKTEAARASI